MPKKYMSKNEAKRLFKMLHPRAAQLAENDKPAVREMWNNFIDAEVKSGKLPRSAYDWSNPLLKPEDR
jgi:hypothetical protein